MGRPHPAELRTRVVMHVEAGHSHRSTARHFMVSVKFVNDMVKLKRDTGSLEPKRQGKEPGQGKLQDHHDWVRDQIAKAPDITLRELTALIAEQHGLRVNSTSVGRLLHRLGLSHKKRLTGDRAKA